MSTLHRILVLGDSPLAGRLGQVYSLTHARVILAILARVLRWRMSYNKSIPKMVKFGCSTSLEKKRNAKKLMLERI